MTHRTYSELLLSKHKIWFQVFNLIITKYNTLHITAGDGLETINHIYTHFELIPRKSNMFKFYIFGIVYRRAKN